MDDKTMLKLSKTIACCGALLAICLIAPSFTLGEDFISFRVPTDNSQPGQITLGSDGNILAAVGKEQKVKQHKHHNGKDLVGDKIKVDGKHMFHQNGKHTAYVHVKQGKIAGVTVTHAEKGDVPVKKYKTTKKMAETPTGGIQRVSLVLAQAQYVGTIWIGYSYIDDLGDEVIYWFPYDMILDGDTGAIEYIPV